MPLKKSQVIEIGRKLLGTPQNVFTVAKAVCGWVYDDDAYNEDYVFEKLEKHAKIFKCEGCNYWLSIESREDEGVDQCADCIAIQNGEDDDDDIAIQNGEDDDDD